MTLDNRIAPRVRGTAPLIREVIERGASAPLPDEEFDRLALEVFALQYEFNPIYRAFCDRRRAAPGHMSGWLEIPAAPTDAFKAAALVTGGDPTHADAVFRTSGTTAGAAARGTHYMLDTGLYRAALRAGFRSHLLPDALGQPADPAHHLDRPGGGPSRMPILSLVPDPREAPDSSLSFMIGEAIAAFGDAASGYFVSPSSGPRISPLTEALETATAEGTPVLLVGASFAFVHLLDALAESGTKFILPHGSRAMDTGGFKGRSRQIGRGELYDRIGEALGIGGEWIVNEYGMTEMSSQFYDGVAGVAPGSGLPRIHRGPGWVRSVAVDPESLRPVAPGEIGILRHIDLANLYSVAVLQTADLGRVTDDGAIELLGRAAGAEARGCSIAVDELLEAMTRNRL
jgi:hypothetical protein